MTFALDLGLIGAIISPCGQYRYMLRRRLGPSPRTACFIMLNPSTADATTDDPTIRRCCDFTRREGCGELVVVNLFAFRSPDPAQLQAVTDPIGPDNHAHVTGQADRAVRQHLDYQKPGVVICAWGVGGRFMDQDLTVLGWLDAEGITPHCLGLTKHGDPRHPLYVRGDAPLVPFAGRRP